VATDSIKIKLRDGASEIEVEAPRVEAEEILEKWWSRLTSANKTLRPTQPSSGVPQLAKSKSENHATKTDGNSTAFDTNGLANSIKDHSALEKIEKKVIHVTGDYFHKVALALWSADRPLTSGQIHAVLAALQIKISLSAVSTVLDRNLTSFITSAPRRSGGTPPTYQLTAKAKAEFEKWLLTDG